MRLWSLHPCYLDAKGLVALWREALLAQKVLLGQTKGYQHHPQLWRFRHSLHPLDSIAYYLTAVQQEASQRAYHFDQTKILPQSHEIQLIAVTDEQIRYEWQHLHTKLSQRDSDQHTRLQSVNMPKPHPLFTIVKGAIAEWEKL